MSATYLPTRTAEFHEVSRPLRPEVSRVGRRRLTVLVALALLVTVATLLLGGSDAGAELADPVAGHVVVAPGETLWDVAVASAPAGVDAREQIRAIQELNGLDGAQVPAWSVLLLPAR